MLKSSAVRALAFACALVAGAFFAGTPAVAQDAPRLGTYKIVSVVTGTTTQLVLRDGGVYEIYNFPTNEFRGRGTYRFDPAARRVIWLSGINHEMGRGGTFLIEDGGTVHRIVLGQAVSAINGK